MVAFLRGESKDDSGLATYLKGKGVDFDDDDDDDSTLSEDDIESF